MSGRARARLTGFIVAAIVVVIVGAIGVVATRQRPSGRTMLATLEHPEPPMRMLDEPAPRQDPPLPSQVTLDGLAGRWQAELDTLAARGVSAPWLSDDIRAQLTLGELVAMPTGAHVLAFAQDDLRLTVESRADGVVTALELRARYGTGADQLKSVLAGRLVLAVASGSPQHDELDALASAVGLGTTPPHEPRELTGLSLSVVADANGMGAAYELRVSAAHGEPEAPPAPPLLPDVIDGDTLHTAEFVEDWNYLVDTLFAANVEAIASEADTLPDDPVVMAEVQPFLDFYAGDPAALHLTHTFQRPTPLVGHQFADGDLLVAVAAPDGGIAELRAVAAPGPRFYLLSEVAVELCWDGLDQTTLESAYADLYPFTEPTETETTLGGCRIVVRAAEGSIVVMPAEGSET